LSDIHWKSDYWRERSRQPHPRQHLVVARAAGGAGGQVHDPQRIDYTHRNSFDLRRAMRASVDVEGYLAWSFFDKFEWQDGYKQRFGMLYAAYQTQRRAPKGSFYWCKQVITSRGASLAGEPAAAINEVTAR
jgi:beta-glucosidase